MSRRRVRDARSILREIRALKLVWNSRYLTNTPTDLVDQVAPSQTRPHVSRFDLSRRPIEEFNAQAFRRDIAALDDRHSIVDSWTREHDAIHNAAIEGCQVP